MLFFGLAMASSPCQAAHHAHGSQTGLWSGSFDRIFVQSLPHPWTLVELNHRLSVPGVAISSHHIHWDGKNGSFMDVDVFDNRIVHMYIKTPDGENLELPGP